MRAPLNAHANIFGNTGLAIQARHFFGALNRLVPICLCPKYGHLPNMPLDEAFLDMLQRLETIDLRAPSICLDAPDEMFRFGGSPKIGYAIFETTRLSQAAVHQLQQLDQVWVPSAWGREILLQHGLPGDRVQVVHEGIDPTIFHPGATPFPQLTSLPTFRFLAVGKWETRKGPVELLRAFDRAFTPDDPVTLVLHFVSRVEPLVHLNIPEEVDRLQLRLRKKILLIEAPLESEADMARLYNSCDAFISATRAEGWGLPISEAMACGLPTVAPFYSGPTAFMTPANSFPLPVTTLEDVYCPTFFRQRGEHGQWAQIDVNSLARQLRDVFSNPAAARERGRQAHRDLHARFTWDHAAQMALAAVEKIL